MSRAATPAAASRPDIFTVIVGTAGHIDHGKSTLVRRLTGIDPDRLPEEKEREMTIDLGFAPLLLPSGKTVGVIDVPGHERFVKNMVAGATSIDIGMLVIDANEGVMPQTREHVEIMQLLGVRAGLIAVTKIDTAGPDMTALAIEDIRETLRGSAFADVTICPVSSHTGEGVEALRAEIQRRCEEAGPRRAVGAFRMPIQRVFSAKGFGTIVTGVPISGRIAVGEAIEILPVGQSTLRGKVRGIQAYRAEAGEARAGHSSAINVADVDWKALSRGMVAAEPGVFEGSQLVEARLTHLPSSRRPLRHRAKIRFHAGTAEALGAVYVLEGKEIAPGGSALVQVRLREPVVVAPGDRFIVRHEAESRTVGGGVVLGTSEHRLKAGKAFVIEALARKEAALGNPQRVLEEALRAAGCEPQTPERLSVRAGLGAADRARLLAALEAQKRAVSLRGGARYVHADGFQAARAGVLSTLEAFYAKEPLRVHVERLELRAASELDEDLFDAALSSLIDDGRVVRIDAEKVAKAGRAVALTDAQADLRRRVLALFEAAPFAPPSAAEAAEKLALTKKSDQAELRKIVGLLRDEKTIVEVAPGVLFRRESLARAREAAIAECRRSAAAGEDFSAALFRDALGTTRKFAIPLLEHFDATGLTARKGASRVLRAPAPP